jgi:hypothetical protein
MKNAARSTPLLLALALLCSNPVKDVKWRTSVDLPITSHKKFYLGAMMDTLFFNHKQVQTNTSYDTIKRAGLPDSIVTLIDTTMKILKAYPAYDSVNKRQIPDTVAFGFPTHDTAMDTISEDSLADKYYEDVFGPIPISGTPTNSASINLNGVNYFAGIPVASPPVPLSVKYVYQVWLDTAQTLNMTVANNTSVDLDSVQVTLSSIVTGPSYALNSTKTIYSLAHNTSGVVQFDVGGKVVDSVLNVTIAATPADSGTFGAGDKLGASFTLNGLKATKVVVLDSLLKDYSRTFTNEYNLTDTVDVSYIDIGKGFFIYSITNYSGLTMLLSVTHRHLWRSDFCQGRNPPLTTINDLHGFTTQDSISASNCDIAVQEQFPSNSTNQYSKHNISANRLFAEWNPVKKKSVTKVDYTVNIGAFGRRITLNASDSLLFVIRTTSFKFIEMYGRSTEQYKRVSEPSTIPVKLPWTQAVTDSLRGNFKLQKVMAMAKTRINIPQGAFIDTMNLHYVLSSLTNTTVACSADVALLHVSRDSVYTRPIDITNVVNDYPDSVKVNVSLAIPVGTPIKAVNDLTDPTDPSYPKFIGRMIIHGLVDYNLVAPLCWTVVDTTILDLGGSKVDLSSSSGVLNPFAKMSDKNASLNMQVINFTNVYLKLYGLAAIDSARADSLVDTANASYIKTNRFTSLINNPTQGYVNLMGNGLLIPPRDSNTSFQSAIALAENELSQILGAKTIGLRWQVRFIPKSSGGVIINTPDALMNTDWMKMNSWFHIDGVNSVDSLFQ